MDIERHKDELGNLGEEFLENDPQQGTGTFTSKHLYGQIEELDADDLPNVDYPPDYDSDRVLGDETNRPGPLDTDVMAPAPSQAIGANEEPGGMLGSTADELLGDDGPDGRDLGDTSADFSPVMRTFGDADPADTLVDLSWRRNVEGPGGMEDQLSTDLPAGGTYGDKEEVVDPATGELSDYDDEPANRGR